MRKFLIAGIAALALGGAGTALAAEKSVLPSAESVRVSSDSIQKTLESMGYRVLRVAAKHDTYKTEVVDTETGTVLKVTYDAATGELREAKPHR